MVRSFTAAAVFTAALSASSALAATLVDNTTQGLYNASIGTALDGTNPFGGNFMFPIANSGGGDPTLSIPATDEPDLSAASAALGNWLTTPAMPGGTWGAAAQAIPSTWAVNTETAIIYEISGGATGLTNVEAKIGVDNGVFLWLNGTFVGGELRAGGASPNEYTFNLGALGSGPNYLQILREDHGGGTGWIIDVTGDVAPSAVPLPASALLLIGGLAGLFAARRKV